MRGVKKNLNSTISLLLQVLLPLTTYLCTDISFKHIAILTHTHANINTDNNISDCFYFTLNTLFGLAILHAVLTEIFKQQVHKTEGLT